MPPASILIVEDEELLAENLKTYLGRHTPDVRVAPDAIGAREILRTFRPDVVVLDYALPGMNGLRVFSEVLCEGDRHPGCVLISGQLTDTLTESAHQRGIRHVLGKPFALGDLQQLVDLSNDATIASAPPDDGTGAPAPACSTERRHNERRRSLNRRSS